MYQAFDKLGRARVTTFFGVSDKFYDLYDAAGRHTAMINDAGHITEYRYDANNRLVGTINYRNTISSTFLTTLDNPDNTLTIAGIRPATHAQDTSSWTVYDDEGRVLQTIAGDGSTTISIYDASGRLQKTTSYVNKVAAATVAGFISAAPTAVITPTANAADTYARYFYDKDGLLIGTMDGEKYIVQNSYDKSGQLTATTAYANATTAASPATASFNTLLAGVTTAASRDRTTRYVYDGRGALRYTVDALGSAVRHDYDAAGLKTRTVAYATALGALADYTFDNVLSQLATQEAALSLVINGAVLHLGLWATRGLAARRGMAVTYRTALYANAAFALVSSLFALWPLLPTWPALILFAAMVLFWITAAVYQGVLLARAHATDTWRGILGVFLPWLVFGCCCGAVGLAAAAALGAFAGVFR